MRMSTKSGVAVMSFLMLILISFLSSRHADANDDNGTRSGSDAVIRSSFSSAQPLLPSLATAEVPELLKDILVGSGSLFTSPSGTQPSGFVEAGGALLLYC